MSYFHADKHLHRAQRLAQTLLLWIGLPIGAAIAAPPTITCSSNPAVFNTGVNSSLDGVAADGSSDANWQVTDIQTPASIPTTPPPSLTWNPAKVGNLIPSAWVVTPFGTAQWISKEYGTGDGTSSTGDWYYRYQFNLDPSVDANQYALNLTFFVDNAVAEIYVNGVAQSAQLGGVIPQGSPDSYNYRGFETGSQASVTLSHNWRSGPNELVVLVHSGAPYEGFLAYVSDKPVCHLVPPASVPTLNQWSMLLLALMVGLLAWGSTRPRAPRA